MPTQEEIVQALGEMPVIKLCELTRELEEKWGVKAVPQVVQQGPQQGPETKPAEEEQTEFTVVLANAGEKKIEVIKAVRTALGLGLKEAKDLVEGGLPKTIKDGLNKQAAEELKAAFVAAGATVELK